MSPGEKLLELYTKYRATSDDDPAKVKCKEEFDKACVASSQNGDFNDQWSAEQIQRIVHSQWLETQRKKLD